MFVVNLNSWSRYELYPIAEYQQSKQTFQINLLIFRRKLNIVIRVFNLCVWYTLCQLEKKRQLQLICVYKISQEYLWFQK